MLERLKLVREALSFGDPDDGMLMKIAKVFRLNIWGDTLLSQTARSGMEMAAVILMVVALFEVGTWSALFNAIIYDGSWNFGWYTPVAVFIGCCFGAVVWVVDRGFITADPDIEPERMVDVRRLRISVILIAAILTAQPVELYLFHGDVEQRRYDEQVLAEAVHMVEDLRSAEATAISIDPNDAEEKMEGSLEMVDVNSSTDAYDEAHRSLVSAKSELETANQLVALAVTNLGDKRQAFVNLTSNRRTPFSRRIQAEADVKTAEGELERAEMRLERAEVEVLATQGRVDLVRSDQSDASGQAIERRDLIEGRMNVTQSRAAADAEMLNGWINSLLRGGPENLPTDPWTQEPLSIRKTGFTDHVRVLWDLLCARSPRWPATTPGIRTQVVETFPGLAVMDEEPSHRDVTDARSMIFLYAIMHIFLVLVPMMSIGYKMIMPVGLRTYYCVAAQARKNNEAAQDILDTFGTPVVPATTV